jgi:hypothetical protein
LIVAVNFGTGSLEAAIGQLNGLRNLQSRLSERLNEHLNEHHLTGPLQWVLREAEAATPDLALREGFHVDPHTLCGATGTIIEVTAAIELELPKGRVPVLARSRFQKRTSRIVMVVRCPRV